MQAVWSIKQVVAEQKVHVKYTKNDSYIWKGELGPVCADEILNPQEDPRPLFSW